MNLVSCGMSVSFALIESGPEWGEAVADRGARCLNLTFRENCHELGNFVASGWEPRYRCYEPQLWMVPRCKRAEYLNSVSVAEPACNSQDHT